MGFYLQGPTLGKADYLLAEHTDFREVTCSEAAVARAMNDNAVVVIVENGPFDAAAFAFSDDEFEDFTQANDLRPKRFLLGPKDLVEELSGYDM